MCISTIELVETRIGLPAVIGKYRGADFWSSINRQPTTESELYLTWGGLRGDQPTQTQPKANGGGLIHGGPDKAVYLLPIGHLELWRAELGAEVMGNRSLGENWRIRGVTESDVHLGDVWEIGGIRLEVSKVRTPCKNLEVYYGGDQNMIKRMTANGLCGWYLRVFKPGLVPTRGAIQVVSQNLSAPTIAEAFAAKMKTPAKGDAMAANDHDDMRIRGMTALRELGTIRTECDTLIRRLAVDLVLGGHIQQKDAARLSGFSRGTIATWTRQAIAQQRHS